MLLAENVTALLVFGLWVAAFALGYVLRYWLDEGIAEWMADVRYSRGVNHGRR